MQLFFEVGSSLKLKFLPIPDVDKMMGMLRVNYYLKKDKKTRKVED